MHGNSPLHEMTLVETLEEPKDVSNKGLIIALSAIGVVVFIGLTYLTIKVFIPCYRNRNENKV